jgi:hypothetical protein
MENAVCEIERLKEAIKRTQIRLRVFALKYQLPDNDHDWIRQHLDAAIPPEDDLESKPLKGQ